MTVEAKTNISAPMQIDSGLVMPKGTDFKKQHGLLNRRNALRAIVSLSIAGVLLSQPKQAENAKQTKMDASPLPLAGEVFTPSEKPAQIEIETALTEIKKIKEKYGVSIAPIESKYFQEDLNDNSQVIKNELPTLEEAKIIEEDLAILPSPDYFAPLIICFSNDEKNAVVGGSQLGWQWPAYFHPSEFKNFPNNFPYDRLVSNMSAIELDLPSVSLSSTLPKKINESANLPATVQIALEQEQIKVNPKEEVPWTTQKERLRQVVVHEYFHSIQDTFSLINSSSIEDYWSKQTFMLWNMETGDVTNPLYETFARINGWKLVSDAEIIKEYDPQYAKDNSGEIKTWKTFHWERDPKVWGDLKNRQNRITVYASYGPIQEAMAEYWMAYKLYPNLLTPQEREYFEKLDNGLKNNPKEFIKKVVENPDILLTSSSSAANIQ